MPEDVTAPSKRLEKQNSLTNYGGTRLALFSQSKKVMSSNLQADWGLPVSLLSQCGLTRYSSSIRHSRDRHFSDMVILKCL